MVKNIIKERKKQDATCPHCKSPDYKMFPPDWEGGKPNFQCQSCFRTWQWGIDGGKYAKLRKVNTK